MSKLSLLLSGRRAVTIVVSIVAHGAIAAAAGGHRGGVVRPTDATDALSLDLDVETVAVPSLPEEEHHDVVANHDRAESHTHPYALPPDHDAHPHSPQIDHRATAGGVSAAASVLATPASTPGLPTFSIVLGNAATATGGLTASGGDGDGTGARADGPVGNAGAKGPAVEATVSEATVSQRARLASILRPEYPSGARTQGIEATVQLELVVDREGKVAEARVVRGTGYGFEDSALRAIRSARFTPAIQSDHPVRVRMPWTIDFRLE